MVLVYPAAGQAGFTRTELWRERDRSLGVRLVLAYEGIDYVHQMKAKGHNIDVHGRDKGNKRSRNNESSWSKVAKSIVKTPPTATAAAMSTDITAATNPAASRVALTPDCFYTRG